MSNDIRIKKGLDIKLVGEATLTKSDAIKSNFYKEMLEWVVNCVQRKIS